MTRILLLVVVASLYLTSRVFSADTPSDAEASRFYFTANGGVAWLDNVSFKNSSGSGTLRFDPGFRLDVAGGYQFTREFSVELETGLTGNRAQGFVDDFYDNESVYLLQTPILANVTYRIPLQRRLKPFIGAGIGGVYTRLENWSVLSDEHNGSDFTFGFQGSAGVRYQISPRTELGVAYKFMGTTDHRLENMDGTRSHSAVIAFLLRF
jgi:opacity protein-like surface antigen